MTDARSAKEGTPGAGVRERLAANPGANRLAEEFQTYLEARLQKVLTGVGHRMGDAAEKLGAAHIGPGALVHGVSRLLGDKAPGKAALAAAATQVAGTAGHAKDALVDTAKTVTDKVTDKATEGGRPSGSGGGRKSMTVIEDIDIGVPVREAYNQWTQFQEFDRFAKGVVNVDQVDDTTTQWEVKVAKATRSFKGTITEQIPDQRIAWTSEGAKGTTRGVVTFHEIGENLTKVLLVMEYFPKGMTEKAGNLVRAQGRRVRLDLKAFRRFVMMQGGATDGWRGEIRKGEVVSESDEEEDGAADEGRPRAQDEHGEQRDERGEQQDEQEEDGDEQDGDEDSDARYADDDAYDDDAYDDEPEGGYDDEADEDGAEEPYEDDEDDEGEEDDGSDSRRDRKS
ncbi:SRPBCC family protein [Streptomyces sp. NPDC003327]